MVTKELVDYIHLQIQQGTPNDDIKATLRASGWQESDIEEAFGMIHNPAVNTTKFSSDVLNFSILTDPKTLYITAWHIFKRKWKLFLSLQIIFFLLNLLVIIIFGAVGISLFLIFHTVSNALIHLIYIILAVLLTITFAVIYGYYISSWAQLTLSYAAGTSEEKISIKALLRQTRSKIFSYILVTLISSVCVFAGLIFFVIPGLVISLLLSFSTFIFIFEGDRGFNALRKSNAYVSGKLLSVLWRFIFIFLINAALTIIITVLPSGFLNSIISLSQPVGSVTPTSGYLTVISKFFIPIFIRIMNVILSFILTPVSLIYNYLLYINLRRLSGPVILKPWSRVKSILVSGGVVIGMFLVISVPLALITGIVITAINPMKKMSGTKDETYKWDVASLQNSLSYYKTKKGFYPPTLYSLVPDYRKDIPDESKYQASFQYQQSKDGQSYNLCVIANGISLQCVFPDIPVPISTFPQISP